MKDLVSVIVPFYNAEKYLKRCADSILNQTYERIELILVNNASDDESQNIAVSYEKDVRVKLALCEDRGVSYSRNMGIRMAAGKWLLFVDADDYIEKDMIEKMISAAASNKDNIQCVEVGFYDEESDGKILKSNYNNGFKKIFKKEDMISELFQSSTGHYQGYLWNKLFLRKIVEENKLQFHTEISYNEDRLFLMEYLMATDENAKSFYLPDITYHYIHHENSAMGRIKSQPVSKVITEINAFEKMYVLSETYGNKQISESIKKESVNAVFRLLTTVSFKNAKKEKKYLKEYLKKHKIKENKYRIKAVICRFDLLICLYKAVCKGT